MEGIKAILISGRTMIQGQNLDSKLSEDFNEVAVVCELHVQDMASLGVAPGEPVKVTTAFGSVVVKAKQDEGNPVGMVFIPMGPWANALVSGNTHGAGMPSYKGIAATVEKTTGPVLSVKELMRTYMG